MLVTSTGGTITWMLDTSTDDASSDTSCDDTSTEDISTGDTSSDDTSTGATSCDDTSTEGTSIWMLDASATKPLPVNLLNRGHLGLSAFQKSSTNTNALHCLVT